MMYILSQEELDKFKNNDFAKQVEDEVNLRLKQFGSILDREIKQRRVMGGPAIQDFANAIKIAMANANIPESHIVNSKGGVINAKQ